MKRIGSLLIGALLSISAGASTSDQDVLVVEQGIHKLQHESLSVARVAVGNPDIADVNIINRHELLITGKQQGVTSLLLWYKGVKQSKAYRLVVKAAENPLASDVDDPAMEGARISPRQISGEFPNLEAHARGAKRLQEGGVDASVVGVDAQVMTEIKIVELSRTTLKQFGFNFLINRLDGTASLTRPGTLNSATIVRNDTQGGGSFNSVELTSGSGFLPLSNAFNVVLGSATRNILGYLSVLETQGLVRTLAQPSLVAMTGQTASFLAGGEFPVPVSQGTSGGISIEYKEFGVRLSLTPTILDSSRIALKVAPEVSELDFSAGVQVSGTSVPALTVRRTDTMVELGSGESFVISGLVSRNLMANVDKVPFLGSVPVLGAFFKSTRYDRDERELVMVVTPHLVKPLKAGAQMPAMPGEEYEQYKPHAVEMILLESGKFKSGFSR